MDDKEWSDLIGEERRQCMRESEFRIQSESKKERAISKYVCERAHFSSPKFPTSPEEFHSLRSKE